MKRSTLAKFTLLIPVFFLGYCLTELSFADEIDQDRTIGRARDVLKEIMATPDQSIPQELLAKCKAIAIYPSVVKGGFLIGGRFGKGVVLKRDKKTGDWGPVSFSTIFGLNAGLQAGIQATDLVLIITNNRGLESLLNSQFTLGADLAVSMGPVGRTSEISTDFFLRSMILSYSRSHGLFAGVALNGAIVSPDHGANSSYYGKAVTPTEILMNGSEPIKPSSKELINVLTQYSAPREKRPKK